MDLHLHLCGQPPDIIDGHEEQEIEAILDVRQKGQSIIFRISSSGKDFHRWTMSG